MRLHNRQIKAAFWTDTDLLRNLDRDGRMFYLGLIQLADDSGCLEDDILAFKVHLYPADMDVDLDFVQHYRDKLVEMDKVIPYTAGGKRCLYLKNFHKHQKLDRPSPPDVPIPYWVQWKEYPGKNPGKYIVSDNKSGEIIKDDKREGDFEEEFAGLLSEGNVLIDGYKSMSVDRQVRLKNSYLDIVASTKKGGYFFELKESYLSGAALAQVVKYQRYIKETGSEFSEAILIGRGIIPSFSYDIAKQNNITVYVLKEDGTLNKLCGNVDIVISRDLTVNQCEKMLLAEPEPEPEPELELELELEPEPKTHMCADAHECDDAPAEKPVSGGAQCKTGKGNSRTRNDYTPEFEEFWSCYPRIKEKARAFKSWNARVRDGTSSDQMITAAQNYAKECKILGTEERFIKLAATFIGPNKPFEEYINWQPLQNKPNSAGCKNKVPNAYASLEEWATEEDY